MSLLDAQAQLDCYQQVLLDLVCLNTNSVCFDCQYNKSTCVNLTVNSFVCNQCCLHLININHRVLPLNSSEFTRDDIKRVQLGGGNVLAKDIWLFHFIGDNPFTSSPPDEYHLKRHILQKYVQQRWFQPLSESSSIHKCESFGSRSSLRLCHSKSIYTAPGLKVTSHSDSYIKMSAFQMTKSSDCITEITHIRPKLKICTNPDSSVISLDPYVRSPLSDVDVRSSESDSGEDTPRLNLPNQTSVLIGEPSEGRFFPVSHSGGIGNPKFNKMAPQSPGHKAPFKILYWKNFSNFKEKLMSK